MIITPTKPLVKLPNEADRITGHRRVLTVIIDSPTPTDGDVVRVQDDDYEDIIPPVTIKTTSAFYREIVVNNQYTGIHLAENTGDRASVYINLAHKNMPIVGAV